MDELTKTCTRCKETKPLSEFGKNNATKDKVHYCCKKCNAKDSKASVAKNPERKATYNHSYSLKNKETLRGYRKQYRLKEKDAIRENSKKWRKENKERIRVYRSQWGESNKERIEQYQSDYRQGKGRLVNSIWEQNNKSKLRAKSHRYKARIRASELSFTSEEWKELCEKYNYLCLCCKEPKPLTVDHIVPVSRGGSNGIDNIQPLCLRCNQSKGTKIIDYRVNYLS